MVVAAPPETSPVYSVPLLGKDFEPAPDIRRIAERLIRQNAHFHHLNDDEIDYLWKRKGGGSKGKVTLGKCVMPSGLTAHYAAGPTFVIWLAADHVHALFMTERQVEALVFHELSHATETEQEDDDPKPALVGHDFEGFLRELEIYGAWRKDFEGLVKVSQQLSLFDEDDE